MTKAIDGTAYCGLWFQRAKLSIVVGCVAASTGHSGRSRELRDRNFRSKEREPEVEQA